jgi:pentatricopeptide repeat protein
MELRHLCSCVSRLLPSTQRGGVRLFLRSLHGSSSFHNSFALTKRTRLNMNMLFRYGHFSGFDPLKGDFPILPYYSNQPSPPESIIVRKLRFENQHKMLGREQAAIELNSILQYWLTSIPKRGVSSGDSMPPTLQQMFDWVESMRPDLQPNLSSYQLLLDACLKTLGDKQIAETLLKRMSDLIVSTHSITNSDKGSDLQAKADPLELTSVLYSFHKVMTLYCKGDEAPQAERLLRELERMSCEHQIPLLSHETYEIVIAGFAKHGKPREAEFILYSMMNQSDTTLNLTKLNIMPDKTAFDSCLNAWVAYPTRNAGQRAELLVLKMQELHEAGCDTKPTYKTYSKIIKAWVNSKHEHALPRIDTILQTIERMDWSDEDNPYNKETVAETYLAAMRMCSYTDRSKMAVKKCVDLFSRLNAVLGLKNVEYKTLQHMYAALIYSWAQSELPETATKVQEIFNEVEAQHKKKVAESSGDMDPHLHSSIYQSLLHAYAKTGSGDKAEVILRRMMQEYLEDIERGLDPAKLNTIDVKCFNSVILAWSRSKDPNAPLRAEKLFRQMCQLQTSKHLHVRLDVVSYNAILAALAESNDVEMARLGDAYFLQMLQSTDPKCRPTTVTYTKAISLWSNIGTREALDRARELWEEMKSSNRSVNIRPNAPTGKAFLAVLKNSSSLLPPDEYNKLIAEANEMIKTNGRVTRERSTT